MRRATLTSCAIALVLGLAGAPSLATAQGEPVHVWLGETAARGIEQHTGLRDGVSALAESGAFDQAMTDWLRETAAYHDRQVLLNEQLAAAAAAAAADVDPKATAPSQVLQQWLAEQDAQRTRDGQQAERLATGNSDPKGAATFTTVREQNSALAARQAATFQRWTTVVVDSTGEVIVNDRQDVQEARLQDLVRRQLEREAEARRLLDREIQERLAGELRTLDREFARARADVGAPSAPPTARNIRKTILTFEECAEDLRRAMAALDAAREDYADCLRRHHGAEEPRDHCMSFDRVVDEKAEEAGRIDAVCVPLGEEVNRGIASGQLDAARRRLEELGIDAAPMDAPPAQTESLEDLELAPLVPSSPSDEVPLDQSPQSSDDDLTLVPLVPR